MCAKKKRYKLLRDEDGRIICVDEDGKRVPLGRCFQIEIGDDDDIQVAVRRSCVLDPETREEVIARLMASRKTVWAVADDDEYDWEETETETEFRDTTSKRRKK